MNNKLLCRLKKQCHKNKWLLKEGYLWKRHANFI